MVVLRYRVMQSRSRVPGQCQQSQSYIRQRVLWRAFQDLQFAKQRCHQTPRRGLDQKCAPQMVSLALPHVRNIACEKFFHMSRPAHPRTNCTPINWTGFSATQASAMRARGVPTALQTAQTPALGTWDAMANASKFTRPRTLSTTNPAPFCTNE